MNPSSATKPVKGDTRDRLLNWIDYLNIDMFSFTNVSTKVGNNIKLEPEYDNIQEYCVGYDGVIALGNFASDALKKLGIEHFKLPHPSPRNLQINDKEFIQSRLDECKNFFKYVRGNSAVERST